MKDKYRKKAFTPCFKVPFRKELDKFYRKIKRLSKNPSDVKKFIEGSYADNPGLVMVYFAPAGIREFLIEAGNHGADIVRILKALKFVYDPFRKGLQPSFPSNINQEIEKYNLARKDFIKKKKALQGAIKLICSLKPLPECSLLFSPYPVFLEQDVSEINEELIAIQNRLKETTKRYLDLMPYTKGLIENKREKSVISERKPITKKSKFWIEPIVQLVDEFKRIGFSDNLAYKTTGKLLHYCYPQYKDPDPNNVGAKYRYHKNQLTIK